MQNKETFYQGVYIDNQCQGKIFQEDIDYLNNQQQISKENPQYLIWNKKLYEREKSKEKALREAKYIKEVSPQQKPILLVKNKSQLNLEKGSRIKSLYEKQTNQTHIQNGMQEILKKTANLSDSQNINKDQKNWGYFLINGVEFLPEGFLELDPILFHDHFQFVSKIDEVLFKRDQKKIIQKRREQYSQMQYPKQREVFILFNKSLEMKIKQFFEKWFCDKQRPLTEKELDLLAKKTKIKVEKLQKIQEQLLINKKEQNQKGLLDYLDKKGFHKNGVYYIPPSLQQYFKTPLNNQSKNQDLKLGQQEIQQSINTFQEFIKEEINEEDLKNYKSSSESDVEQEKNYLKSTKRKTVEKTIINNFTIFGKKYIVKVDQDKQNQKEIKIVCEQNKYEKNFAIKNNQKAEDFNAELFVEYQNNDIEACHIIIWNRQEEILFSLKVENQELKKYQSQKLKKSMQSQFKYDQDIFLAKYFTQQVNGQQQQSIQVVKNDNLIIYKQNIDTSLVIQSLEMKVNLKDKLKSKNFLQFNIYNQDKEIICSFVYLQKLRNQSNNFQLPGIVFENQLVNTIIETPENNQKDPTKIMLEDQTGFRLFKNLQTHKNNKWFSVKNVQAKEGVQEKKSFIVIQNQDDEIIDIVDFNKEKSKQRQAEFIQKVFLQIKNETDLQLNVSLFKSKQNNVYQLEIINLIIPLFIKEKFQLESEKDLLLQIQKSQQEEQIYLIQLFNEFNQCIFKYEFQINEKLLQNKNKRKSVAFKDVKDNFVNEQIVNTKNKKYSIIQQNIQKGENQINQIIVQDQLGNIKEVQEIPQEIKFDQIETKQDQQNDQRISLDIKNQRKSVGYVQIDLGQSKLQPYLAFNKERYLIQLMIKDQDLQNNIITFEVVSFWQSSFIFTLKKNLDGFTIEAQDLLNKLWYSNLTLKTPVVQFDICSYFIQIKDYDSIKFIFRGRPNSEQIQKYTIFSFIMKDNKLDKNTLNKLINDKQTISDQIKQVQTASTISLEPFKFDNKNFQYKVINIGDKLINLQLYKEEQLVKEKQIQLLKSNSQFKQKNEEFIENNEKKLISKILDQDNNELFKKTIVLVDKKDTKNIKEKDKEKSLKKQIKKNKEETIKVEKPNQESQNNKDISQTNQNLNLQEDFTKTLKQNFLDNEKTQENKPKRKTTIKNINDLQEINGDKRKTITKKNSIDKDNQNTKEQKVRKTTLIEPKKIENINKEQTDKQEQWKQSTFNNAELSKKLSKIIIDKEFINDENEQDIPPKSVEEIENQQWRESRWSIWFNDNIQQAINNIISEDKPSSDNQNKNNLQLLNSQTNSNKTMLQKTKEIKNALEQYITELENYEKQQQQNQSQGNQDLIEEFLNQKENQDRIQNQNKILLNLYQDFVNKKNFK